MPKAYCFAHGIRNRFSCLGFLFGLSIVGFAFTLTVQAGPHRHGVSELLVALDGNNLTLELTTPGKDIAGFENAPNTHEQKERYAKIVVFLKSAEKMFSLSEKAACRADDVRMLEHLSDKHDDAHADDAAHGEFRVRYVYSCDSPQKLKQIVVKAFERFDAMQAIELKFIGPLGQAVRHLTRRKPAANI